MMWCERPKSGSHIGASAVNLGWIIRTVPGHARSTCHASGNPPGTAFFRPVVFGLYGITRTEASFGSHEKPDSEPVGARMRGR
jgi:hypothetical protein